MFHTVTLGLSLRLLVRVRYLLNLQLEVVGFEVFVAFGFDAACFSVDAKQYMFLGGCFADA